MFGLSREVHVTNFSSGTAPVSGGIEGNRTPFLWKACMVIAGAYTFYLLESLLRQCAGEEVNCMSMRFLHTMCTAYLKHIILYSTYDHILASMSLQLGTKRLTMLREHCLFFNT